MMMVCDMKQFKYKIRDILIYFIYYSGFSWLRLWILRLTKKPLLRVIAYHEIKDSQRQSFQKQLAFLQKKFNIISPDDFLNKRLSKKKINILISFDDAHQTWLKNVLSVLKERGLWAIFFTQGGAEGLAKEIFNNGFTLGGHTLSHKRLPPLSLEEMRKEIRNNNLVFFAYPFGDKKSFSPVVIEQVKAAGYQYAFTILPGFNTRKTNKFLLHRDSVDPSWSEKFLKIWLSGAYDSKSFVASLSF